MGQDGRQRREARRRAHPRTSSKVSTPHEADPSADIGEAEAQQQIIALIETAARFAQDAPRGAGPLIAHLNEIGRSAPMQYLDPAALVVNRVLSCIHAAYEHGWQPSDLVHAARRRATSPAAAWLAEAVSVEADRSKADERAPQHWLDQLDALASGRPRPAGPAGLLETGGRATETRWVNALVAIRFISVIPRSDLLVPPPSQWGTTHHATSPARPRQQGDDRHDKTLVKIRALLAKAESSDFAAEAEAFTAKAQDLMTRYSIDEALLADGGGGSIDVSGVRVLVHQPYADEKAALLDVIARANRVRAVWNDFASCVTLVGVPTDLAQVEMLFTSTLIQATRAMTQVGEKSGGRDRSVSFRKAFLTAYAYRIGERLSMSSAEAEASYGTDLVPVFERQAVAIAEEFERLFPHVTTRSRRGSFDARGWHAGTRAADEAVLPAGEVGA